MDKTIVKCAHCGVRYPGQNGPVAHPHWCGQCCREVEPDDEPFGECLWCEGTDDVKPSVKGLELCVECRDE